MARRPAVLAAASVLVVVAGCSSSSAGGTAASAPASPTTSAAVTASQSASPTTEDSPTTSAEPSPSSATAKPSVAKPADPDTKYATVNLGRFATDPAATALAAYAVARGRANAVYSSSTPALMATATASWRGVVAQAARDLKSQGRRAGAVQWSLVGLSRTGSAATLRTCVWRPSSADLSAKTGKPVETLPKEWVPLTISLTDTGGNWKVRQIVIASFSCKEAQ